MISIEKRWLLSRLFPNKETRRETKDQVVGEFFCRSFAVPLEIYRNLIGGTRRESKRIKWPEKDVHIYLKELWRDIYIYIYTERDIATEQPRRVVAVRALLAPWNSTWLVSSRSSRDRPPPVNAQTLRFSCIFPSSKTYRFVRSSNRYLSVHSIFEFTRFDQPLLFQPPPFNDRTFNVPLNVLRETR